MKRGAIPSPRSELAAAAPHSVIGATPAKFLVKPAKISFWHNDQYGDCVTAEEAFAKACHKPEIFINDETVFAWASAHGVLNGAVLVTVLKDMICDGFKQDKHTYDDGNHFSVDWTNASILENAISHGPVKLGVAANQLDNVVTPGKNGWFATGFNRDQAEDHCVSLCGYGTMNWLAEEFKVAVPAGVDGTQPGYAMFTWDSIGIIDVPSMIAITEEAWLRKPTTIIK
jgi:hypothetical protein